MEKKHQYQGLTKQEVEESRRLHGENVLTPPKKASLWSQFLEKFEDPIIRILLVAWLLSMIIAGVHCWGPEAKGFTAFLEPIGIFFAIMLASCVGFFFEVKANKAFDILNTVNDDTAREKEDADATATILIGNTDENGDYYATVKGYEHAVYLLSNSLLELKPFNLILKIPALVNIDTLESADMTVGKKTYTMKLDGEKYKFNKKSVKKEKFTELYQALQSVMLDSEIGETKSAEEKEEVLSVTFHRNTEEAPEITLKYYTYDDIYDSLEINGTERFLVKAEDVDALVKQIKKAF